VFLSHNLAHLACPTLFQNSLTDPWITASVLALEMTHSPYLYLHSKALVFIRDTAFDYADDLAERFLSMLTKQVPAEPP
jgi:hypothetical protein